MNINASIIDQQLSGLLEKHADWFPDRDETKRRSIAFVVLCMANFLDFPLESAIDWLTDGGNDAGIDGLHIGDVEDGEFVVTIFQAKYKKNWTGFLTFLKTMYGKFLALFRCCLIPIEI